MKPVTSPGIGAATTCNVWRTIKPINERGPKESRKDVSLFLSIKKWNVPLLYRTRTSRMKVSRRKSLIHVLFLGFLSMVITIFRVIDFHSFLISANFSINGLIRSIGTGNIIVEFFSVAISVRVWRNLSCKADGAVAIIFAASASFCEA